MANDDSVWIPVLPSLKDFGKNLESGTKGAGSKVGERVGREIADGISKSEAAVRKASGAAEKAHNRVADAAGKVRVAQEQYNKALESGDPVRIARAEEGLATARRRQSEATTAAETADRNLTDAQGRLADAHERSEEAAREQARAVGESTLSAEEAEQASHDLESAQRILEVGLLAVGTAAVAAAGYLATLGDDFHQMSRDIRVATGATGDDLAALEESVMTVATTVPVAFDEAAAALSNLNTSTGETGEGLEYLTGQVLEASNLLGEDGVGNSEAFGRALSQWQIDAREGGDALDGLFAVTQEYGIGLGEVTGNLNTYGSVLNNAGFSMEEAATLFGSLNQSGLEVSRLMPGLNAAFRNWAGENKDVQAELEGTVGQIRDAETAQEALALATDTFGAEGAQRLVTAIRNGSFALEDFGTALGDTDGLVGTTAEETRTLGEEFQLFKNEAMAEIKPIATEVFDILLEGGQWVRDEVVPAIKDLADWVVENKDTLSALAVGVGTAVVAFGAFRAVMVAITAAQRIWNVVNLLSTQGVRGLNAAMRANVIGIIVTAIAGLVAGLTYFFTQTETGQRIWEALVDAFSTGWEWIKGAFQAAWDFIQPIFMGIWEVIQQVGEVFVNIVQAYFVTYWNILSSVIWFVWDTIIRPVWDAMQVALQALGDFFVWVWNGLIKPTWDALGAGIDWVWQNIIRPAWDALTAALGAVGDFFSWVWNSVIKPVWDAFGDGIDAVWRNVVEPVFEALKTGVDLVGQAFETAVDWISDVWDRIREITAKPVKFVIDTVYNDGIRAVWNRVAGWLGLEELDEMPMPSMLDGFASGGVLPGYTPGRDIYEFIEPRTGLRLGLGGGEGIMRPEFVQAVGGPEGIDDLNMRARRGLPLGHAGNYAAGGVLPGWEELTTDIQRAMAASVAQAFPNQRITSGTRYHDVGAGFDNHMQGRAVDFGLPGGPLASWIAREYGPSVLELFWDPGPNLVNGNPHGAIGGHSDHVHWAMAHIVDPYTGDVISQEGQGDGGTSGVRSLIANAFSSIMDPIMDMIPEGDGLFGGFARGMADKLVDSVRDFLMGQSGGSSDHGDWVGTPGVEQFRGLVERLLAEKGHDLGLTGSVLRRMAQESTGDPNAINLWDSNAMQGWPTKGLMQMRDDTFISNADPGYTNIWEPEDNIRSSLNYAMNEYGSISAAYDRAGGYDDGGYLMPGTTLAVNETPDPEPVFTGRQWKDLRDLIAAVVDLTPAMEAWVDEGLAELEHFANTAAAVAEEMRPEWEEFTAGIVPSAQSELGDSVAEFFGVDGIVNDVVGVMQSMEQARPTEVAAAPVAVAEPPADAEQREVTETGEVPLVHIENLHAEDEDAATAVGREVRRAVRSDNLVGGWR